MVQSCSDGQKHSRYEIADNIHELYLFGLKSLKALQPKQIYGEADIFIDENYIQRSALDKEN
jgi:hypothetical protein